MSIISMDKYLDLDGTILNTTTDWLGHIRYYKNSRLHRLDGPAVIYTGGGYCFYLDHKKHRIGGPAFYWPWNLYPGSITPQNEWWVNNKKVEVYYICG